MHVADILSAERVACDVHASSKKKVLQKLSELLSSGESELEPGAIAMGLHDREKLGSTGLGHGVAIPHARVPGAQRTVGAFMRLAEPVDFEATDGEPVDLVFGLLVPEDATEEHLAMLRRLAQLLSSTTLRARLRSLESTGAILDVLSEPRNEEDGRPPEAG